MSRTTYCARVVAAAIGLLIAAVAIIASVLPATPAAATYGDEAAFDAALFQRINEHRVSEGLDLLILWQPLSDYAIDHSEFMAAGSNNCNSTGTNWGHSNLSITHPANPPGTTAVAENINYNCGVPGIEFVINWPNGGGPLPAYCTDPIDYTIADKTACDWLASPSHRATIENPAFTHVGVGTDSVVSGTGSLERFSTMDFAAADVPAGDVSCTGVLDITDALMIAQYDIGIRFDVGSCALNDPATQLNADRGDLNDDGVTNIVDALAIAQCVVGMNPCP